MTAPFPYEGVSGAIADGAEAEALNLYRNYVWIARLVDEMNTEAQLDAKKTMQLVFHSRQFRRWYDALQDRVTAGTHTQAQIGDVVQGVFLLKKCTWATRAAMNVDLQSIYNVAGTAADWIEANAGEYKTGYSINKELSPGVYTDESIKVAKSTGIATRLANFRALFGVKG